MNGRGARALMIATLTVLALAGCGSSSKSSGSGGSSPSTAATTAATRPNVTIEAHDYGYTLPAEIPAGWVDVTLKNTGKEGHQISFVKLNSTPYATFVKAVKSEDLKLLGDVVWVGGPNNAEPGQSVTATVHFAEGDYGVMCLIPASDGKSHAVHGMVGQVKVAKTAQSTETAPTATGGKISTSEFTFVVDPSFTGKGTVQFENVGTQVHEVIIMRINPGKTLAAVKGYLLTAPGTPPPSGPPPFTSAGGIVGLGPHQTMYQTMALAPGHYALLCFFPDPNKGNLPHALEGMIKEITVS